MADPAATGEVRPAGSWRIRAAERAGLDRRSRSPSVKHAELIVEAARRLTAEKGASFTIQELAKDAGVSLQTFYRHFAGKEELILAVIEETIAESCEAFEAEAEAQTEPLDRLRSYVVGTLQLLQEPSSVAARRFITSQHYRLHEIYPDELAQATQAFTRLLVPEIEAAAAAGLLDPDDVERDAWFVTQIVMSTFHHYSFAEGSRPPADLPERVWEFCLKGLGGAPGPARRGAGAEALPDPREALVAATRWAAGSVRELGAALRRVRPR